LLSRSAHPLKEARSLAAGRAKAGKASFDTSLAEPACIVAKGAFEQEGGGSLISKAGLPSEILKPSEGSFVKQA
jgi:hypothetical protein